MAVLRLTLLLGKLLAGIALAFFTCGERQPLILCAGLGWYIWLRHKNLTPKQKVLTTFGLGCIAVGWGISWFVRYYGMKVEGCHFPGEADPWMLLSRMSFWVGLGAMTLGWLALAYVDAFRTLPTKLSLSESGKSELRQDQVWPPAPKQSQ